MAQNELKILIEKYYQGETSLLEERKLLMLLEKEQDPKLEPVKAQVLGMKALKKDHPRLERNIIDRLENRRSSSDKRWFWLAASLVIALGASLIFSWYTHQSENDTYSAEEIKAFEDTKKALYLLSTKFNKGADNIEKLSKFHNTKIKITDHEN